MASGPMQDERNDVSLRKIQVVNWLLLLAMSGTAGVLHSGFMARSVFLGGVIATVSFGLLRRDLLKLLSGPLQAAKARFFINYYLRLTLLAIVLFVLIRYRLVQIIGLLAGLATVMLSIGVNAAGAAKKIYFPLKEAA